MCDPAARADDLPQHLALVPGEVGQGAARRAGPEAAQRHARLEGRDGMAGPAVADRRERIVELAQQRLAGGIVARDEGRADMRRQPFQMCREGGSVEPVVAVEGRHGERQQAGTQDVPQASGGDPDILVAWRPTSARNRAAPKTPGAAGKRQRRSSGNSASGRFW